MERFEQETASELVSAERKASSKKHKKKIGQSFPSKAMRHTLLVAKQTAVLKFMQDRSSHPQRLAAEGAEYQVTSQSHPVPVYPLPSYLAALNPRLGSRAEPWTCQTPADGRLTKCPASAQAGPSSKLNLTPSATARSSQTRAPGTARAALVPYGCLPPRQWPQWPTCCRACGCPPDHARHPAQPCRGPAP